jgi:hypothetical protein
MFGKMVVQNDVIKQMSIRSFTQKERDIGYLEFEDVKLMYEYETANSQIGYFGNKKDGDLYNEMNKISKKRNFLKGE